MEIILGIVAAGCLAVIILGKVNITVNINPPEVNVEAIQKLNDLYDEKGDLKESNNDEIGEALNAIRDFMLDEEDDLK